MTVEQIPPADITEMLTTMDRLSEEIRALRKELGEQRELHTRELHTMNVRARRMKILTIILALLVIVGCVFTYQNRKTLEDFHTQRTESRRGACIQFNVTTQGQRTALHNALLTFVPDPDNMTAEQKTSLTKFDDAVENALPYRDCSDDGIDAYYSDPPPDPAVKP